MWRPTRVGALVVLVALAAAGRSRFYENSYTDGQRFDLRVYLSSADYFSDFNNTEALLWSEEGLTYTAAFAERTKEVRVPLSDRLLERNGTLFAHIFVTKAGRSPDPRAKASYDKWATSAAAHQLVSWGERLKPRGLYNLLTGEPAPWEAVLRDGLAAAKAAGEPEGQYIAYWKPALHAQLLISAERKPAEEMPQLLLSYLQAYRLLRGGKYLPLVYINELTVMRQHWLALNASFAEEGMPLELTFKPLPLSRFQWMLSLQQSFKMNEETLGLTDRESEEMRGMFFNTPPALLYTTVAVSAVHLLFDVLAFKSDMNFWNSVDSMEGLSSRTLVMNQLMEGVILLYLFEEDASWLVKITSLLSLALGVFKILKSFSVRKREAAKKDGRGSLTDEIDALAFRYLSPPLLLLVLGYAGYTLWRGYYRSWYAWILESLVALVYGGGFIVMTPQLFINYKLKSIAHLPWKFFMYKALNTFIDDLFAFIIKMPTLHRMSCFRDDIVFAVFLYQRHVYKVDMSRVNEFGQRGDAPAAGDEKGGEKQKRDEKGGAGGAKKKGREQAQESKKDK